MKKLFILLLVAFTTSAHAQLLCGNGRYENKIFTNIAVERNIAYGQNVDYQGNNTTLAMDVYYPAGDLATVRPLIIFAHGGSFIGGSRTLPDVTKLCEEFAKRGYVTVTMSYRLGVNIFSSQPLQEQFGAAVWRGMQDGRAAVRYFKKDFSTINKYRIDTNNIYIGGVSAGGVLGLSVGYINKASEIPSAVDTVLLGGIEGNSGNPGYSSRVTGLISLCGAVPVKVDYMNDNANLPVFAVHGTNDNTVPYKTDYFRFLGNPIDILCGGFSVDSNARVIGAHSFLHTYKGADHVPWLSGSNLAFPAFLDTAENFLADFLLPLVCPNVGIKEINNDFSATLTAIPQYNGNLLLQTNGLPTQQVSISIYNLEGKEIYRNDINIGQDERASAQLLIGARASGIYLWKLTTSNGMRSGRIWLN